MTTIIGNEINSNQPLTISDTELNQHLLIIGTTGSGKTNSILNFVNSGLSRNLPIIYMDGKGSPDLIYRLAIMAKKYNRTFKVFALRPNLPHIKPYLASYNPFSSGGATEWKNRIMSLFTAVNSRGQEHFSLGEQHYINFVANVLAKMHESGAHIDLKILLSLLENRISLVQHAHYLNLTIMAQKLTLLNNNKDIQSLLGDVLKLLELFIYSDYGYLFNTIEHQHNIINIKQSILDNEIVLFLFDASAYPEDTAKIAKMVINDINSSFASFEKPKKCFCIFDEFASYASSNLAETISLHRSQGMHAIIGTQSINTVKLKNQDSKRIAEELIASCNTYMVHTINHPIDANIFADIMGTHEIEKIQTKSIINKDPQNNLLMKNSYRTSNIQNKYNNYYERHKNSIFSVHRIFRNLQLFNHKIWINQNINTHNTPEETIISYTQTSSLVREYKVNPQNYKTLATGMAIIYRKAIQDCPRTIMVNQI